MIVICLYCIMSSLFFSIFFFFNDTATTEIYTLSLHDALPILQLGAAHLAPGDALDLIDRRAVHREGPLDAHAVADLADRKSTRLNSSHSQISYAVFCLKKKKQQHRFSYRKI